MFSCLLNASCLSFCDCTLFGSKDETLHWWQLHLRWHSDIELIVCTCSTEYKTLHAHFHTVASNVLISEGIMGLPVTIVKQELLCLKSCEIQKRKMQTVRLTVKIGLNVKSSAVWCLKLHSCMSNQSLIQNNLRRSICTYSCIIHRTWSGICSVEACVLCVPGRRRAAAKPPAKPRQKLDTMFLGRDQLGNLAFGENTRHCCCRYFY